MTPEEQLTSNDLTVIYDDNHIFAVIKPAGIPVQAGKPGLPCLHDLAKAWVGQKYRKTGKVYLGIVHRLDQNVSGIMAFARTSKAARRLNEQIRDGRVRKKYLAIVEGRMPASAGIIQGYIKKLGLLAVSGRESDKSARYAELTYEVSAQYARRALVEIDLKTGRFHQIRHQLAKIGCPVLGDKKYGAKQEFIARELALFNKELSFEHPVKKEPVTLTLPMPDRWKSFLN